MPANSLLKSTSVYLVILAIGLSLSALIARVDYDQQTQSHDERTIDWLTGFKSRLAQVLHKRLTLTLALEAFARSHQHLDLAIPEQGQQFHTMFDAFTRSLESEVEGVMSFQLAPDAVVTFVSNEAANKKAVGHDLLVDDNRRQQVLETIASHSQIVAGPMNLIQGGEAIIVRKAIFTTPGAFDPVRYASQRPGQLTENWVDKIPSDFWGLATVLLDTGALYRDAGLSELSQAGVLLAIRGKHGLGEDGEMIWGDASVFDHPSQRQELFFEGGSWQLAIQSQASVSYLPTLFILLTGLGLSGLLIFALRANQEKLLAVESGRTKESFLATMSHEIRTPMVGINGFADLLLDQDLPDSSVLLVQRIKSSTNALQHIIDDILDISKLNADKLSIEMLDFNFEQMIDEIASSFSRHRASDKAVTISIELADDFPRAIHSDPTRVRQILTNLISNAFKFTLEGKIRIIGEPGSADDESPKLKVSVVDSGIGIAQSVIPSLFNDFTQADSTISRRFEGTGLGLSICKRLLVLLGGDIGVKSILGKGSCFWFTLPYQEASITAIVNQEKPLAGAYQATRKLRILAAEDARVNQIILRKFIEATGAAIDIVENGREAINALDENDYDLLLMDIRMPIMDGLEATQAIRSKSNARSRIPIIALTADVLGNDQNQYQGVEITGIVAKPYKRSDLFNTINQVLNEDVFVFQAELQQKTG